MSIQPAAGSTLAMNLDGRIRVSAGRLEGFVERCFIHLGLSSEHARIAARGVVMADLVGHESHGVTNNLAAFYFSGLETGSINPRANIRIVHETPVTSRWDGDRGMGFVVGHIAMTDAIERAARYGAGFATVADSRHFGMAQIYSRMALAHDMVGLTMSTGVTPEVVPFQGLDAKLQTNPISVAAPCGEQPPYVLDMSTTTAAIGKIRQYRLDGRPIPPTWALDSDGCPTTDPQVALDAGRLTPFGGSSEGAGHKGYGLMVWVDIFCSALSGAGFVARPGDEEKANHFFGAWRVDAFIAVDEYKRLMDERMCDLRSTRPSPGNERVLVAGQPEFEHMQDRLALGIPLRPSTIDMLRGYAGKYKVDFDLLD